MKYLILFSLIFGLFTNYESDISFFEISENSMTENPEISRAENTENSRTEILDSKILSGNAISSLEFIEKMELRTQNSRYYYNESSNSYRFVSDSLVQKSGIFPGTDWITSEEYPIEYIIVLRNKSVFSYEDINLAKAAMAGLANTSIYLIGIESYSGLLGFFLDSGNTTEAHSQYVYFPRLKDGTISSYRYPSFSIYPHLFIETGGVYSDIILSNNSLFKIENQPRNNLKLFEGLDTKGIKFSSIGLNFKGTAFNVTFGFKYNSTDRQFHQEIEFSSNRSFQDVGLVFDITSSPQERGSDFEPSEILVKNETQTSKLNVSTIQRGNETLENISSVVDIISQNNEVFSFDFSDMEQAGFTEKILEISNKKLPNGQKKNIIQLGMLGYGTYSAFDVIQLDPTFSQIASVDEQDFWVENNTESPDSYSSVDGQDKLAMGWDEADNNRTSFLAWNLGISDYITSVSNVSIIVELAADPNLEANEYIEVGFYYNESLANGFWNESYSETRAKTAYLQQMNTSVLPGWRTDAPNDAKVTINQTTMQTLMEAWVILHNEDQHNRQFFNLMLRCGLNCDWMPGTPDDDDIDFEESSYITEGDRPSFTFDYTIRTANISDFQFYKNITINSSLVAENVTNFPLLVSGFDADLNISQDDADDIIFTDDAGSTVLDFEIELFNRTYNNTHSELVAWVRIPELNNITDTIIRMYYGNSTTSNQENVAGVWDSNYRAVWHLNEDPTGGVFDSTSYNNNGDSVGSMTSDDQISGQIDGSLDFDGDNDYISVPDDPDLSAFSALTVSIWFNVNEWKGTGYETVVGKGNDGSNQREWRFRHETDFLKFGLSSNGTNEGLETVEIPLSAIPNNTWHYITATWTTGTDNMKIYLNGTLIDSNTHNVSSAHDSTDGLAIAASGDGAVNRTLNGTVDEVRVSNIVRSINWIITEYNNQFNITSFIAFGNQTQLEDVIAPELDSPADQNFLVGESADKWINWTATDLTPANYSIERNGVGVDNGTWASGIPINYSLSGLGEGTWNFTIIVNDTSSNEALDTVFIFVTEFLLPQIDSPADQTLEAGHNGENISWTPTERDNGTDEYLVFRESILVENGTWSNQTPIVFDLDPYNLTLGTFNYTIFINDTINASVSDTVLITIQDTTNPVLDTPADVNYNFGETGNWINWTGTDFLPMNYSVIRNGSYINNGTWLSSISINISVDGLAVETYNYTILINDTSNNQALDLVLVIVSEAPVATTVTTTATIVDRTSTMLINEIKPDPFLFMTDWVIVLQSNWMIILFGILVITIIVKRVR